MRNSKYSKYARVAYVGAALCFSLASVAGVVAAAAASTNPVVSVSVHDFAFTPNTLTIVKGTQVRFTNTGESLHRVVSDDGSFDSHPLQPGHNATFTFDTAGVFHLHCEIHPAMTMTVTVLASAPAAGAGGGGGSGSLSGTSQSATAANPVTTATTLPRTGVGLVTTVMAIFGLGLIILGMLCLAVGRKRFATIPAIAARPAMAGPAMASIARVMGWENRFDDLLPRARRN
jgi:plastocyanin